MGEIFLSNVSYATETVIYRSSIIMVANWACEVTVILTKMEASSVLHCVRISVTSQAQLAKITSSYFCCK